jgi:hypothetical protein
VAMGFWIGDPWLGAAVSRGKSTGKIQSLNLQGLVLIGCV